MRAVVFEDVGRVRVDEVPEPRVEAPTDAVVRVTRAAICGSDLHLYHGKSPMSPGEQLGHEAVGVVESVGPDVTRFAPGDRVAVAFTNVDGECWFCRNGQHALCEEIGFVGYGVFGGGLGGAQAELLRVPHADHNLLALPDDLDDDRALFVGDVLTTGVYAAGIAGIRPGDTVAVIGAGPVGFFAAQAARLHDPARVLVLDMDASRLALMEGIGAEPVNVGERNAQMATADVTEGRGADVVIECVGSVPAFDSALEAVRRGGTVVVIGVYVHETVELQLGVASARALRLVFGGLCPVQAWWEQALDALREGRLDPTPLISHRLPLEDAARGYELFDRREATKVVLQP